MEYEQMAPLIRDALEKYPRSTPQDIVKLLYQSEFGPAHAISDPSSALGFLRREYSLTAQEEGPLLERIGGGYARLRLKALDANGVSPETAAEWFVKSAVPAGDKTEFEKKLLALAGDPSLAALMPGLAPFIAEYVAMGCPAVHHSAEYRAAYFPAYRVVKEELWETLLPKHE